MVVVMGREILFVSNRGHIYGTGGFWRMEAEPGADAQEIHYEETTWKARPDFSPDGTGWLYSVLFGIGSGTALGDAGGWGGCISAFVWGLG